MNIAIIYSSQQGYAHECAKQIADELTTEGKQTELVDVSKGANKLAIAEYDTIILGGGITVSL